MTENRKKKIGIILLTIMLLSLVLYSSIVVAEFYVSKNGEIVEAKVTDVSQLCRHKRKYVTLLIGSTSEHVKIYGPSCRQDEFVLGSTIQVRRSVRLGILTLQNNLSTTRLVFFPLFTIAILMALISSIKSLKVNSQ
jgi:hypothetical protein